MTAIRAAVRAFGSICALLLWHVFGILPPGPRATAHVGRHRLDAMPVHQGYADMPERLAELAEKRGRHAS